MKEKYFPCRLKSLIAVGAKGSRKNWKINQSNKSKSLNENENSSAIVCAVANHDSVLKEVKCYVINTRTSELALAFSSVTFINFVLLAWKPLMPTRWEVETSKFIRISVRSFGFDAQHICHNYSFNPSRDWKIAHCLKFLSVFHHFTVEIFIVSASKGLSIAKKKKRKLSVHFKSRELENASSIS